MAITYVSAEALAFKKEVELAAHLAGVTALFKGRVWVDIKYYPNRPKDWQKRQREFGILWDDTVQAMDLGNVEKVLSDALQNVVLENDKFIWKLTMERMEPDGECRVEVTITEIIYEVPQLELV